MDTKTLIEAEARAVGAGIRTPNEARKRLNTGPVDGGDTPYLQQQNFSLRALDKRDQKPDPFAGSSGGAPQKGIGDYESFERVITMVAKAAAREAVEKAITAPPKLDFEYDGDRTLTVTQMHEGELIGKSSFSLPIPLDRGLWAEGQYHSGDGVTFQSNYWIAKRSTFAKPGTDDSWRLSVKRGRDGRDAEGKRSGKW